jgi:hypothetical protein
MNLATARQYLRSCCERMDALYQKPVFDEWVIASFAQGKTDILAYDGPRPESFVKQFHRDAGPIFAQMQGRRYAVGDFEFAQQARSSRFDACVRLGEVAYLLCNNTYGTLDELRQDARWLEAQKPLVDLTEKFRADPLV